MDHARIGERLRALREDRGMTQRELAALVGQTAANISLIESGQTRPPMATVEAIAEALGARFEYAIVEAGDHDFAVRFAAVLHQIDPPFLRMLETLVAELERGGA